MITDMQSALAAQLKSLYPLSTVYLDYVPQNFKTPSFLIEIIDQGYGKRLQGTFRGTCSFDLQYFSAVKLTDIAGIEADCHAVQEVLLRELDLIGTFRALNKAAKTTDNVLHLTFDIKYCEKQISTVPVVNKLTIGAVSVKE